MLLSDAGRGTSKQQQTRRRGSRTWSSTPGSCHSVGRGFSHLDRSQGAGTFPRLPMSMLNFRMNGGGRKQPSPRSQEAEEKRCRTILQPGARGEEPSAPSQLLQSPDCAHWSWYNANGSRLHNAFVQHARGREAREERRGGRKSFHSFHFVGERKEVEGGQSSLRRGAAQLWAEPCTGLQTPHALDSP